MLWFIIKCKRIYDDFVKDEITVYAAQASFFTVLSFFPFLMVLLTLIQLIPAVSQEDLLAALRVLVPSRVFPLVESVVFDLYTSAPAALLSVSTIATIWSAARGMLGIERGLNRIAGCRRRRGYLVSRLVNSGYTAVFLLVCLLTLILMVFGSSLQSLLLRWLPFLRWTQPYLTFLRPLAALAVLILFFTALYTYLPFRPMRLRAQLPGAVFSTLGWLLLSWGFSFYFTLFGRLSYMYGSLTAVVLFMLWIYLCVCILFLGAEINRHWRRP